MNRREKRLDDELKGKLPWYPTIYKPTNDDWHGNFENNTVELSYIGKLSDGTFRVLVKGNDDTGYERDFFNWFKEKGHDLMINTEDVAFAGCISADELAGEGCSDPDAYYLEIE